MKTPYSIRGFHDLALTQRLCVGSQHFMYRVRAIDSRFFDLALNSNTFKLNPILFCQL